LANCCRIAGNLKLSPDSKINLSSPGAYQSMAFRHEGAYRRRCLGTVLLHGNVIDAIGNAGSQGRDACREYRTHVTRHVASFARSFRLDFVRGVLDDLVRDPEALLRHMHVQHSGKRNWRVPAPSELAQTRLIVFSSSANGAASSISTRNLVLRFYFFFVAYFCSGKFACFDVLPTVAENA
jgi:hypothetical protein